jgi:hypothetical protein
MQLYATIAGSVLAWSLVTAPAWAQTDFEQTFDVSPGQGSIQVGKKGQQKKHQYGLQRNRVGQQLELTLTEQGKKGSKFYYNEGQNSIQLTVGGQTLTIAIKKDQVSVGATTCLSDDTSCIGKAVYDALPGLTAQEVAAAMVALEGDLAAMKHGAQIQQVLESLAIALATAQGNL